MKIGLSGIKNLIWALGILIVLLALLVALIFSFSQKYSGERESGTIVLEGPSEEVAENEEVKRIYLGGKETWVSSLHNS